MRSIAGAGLAMSAVMALSSAVSAAPTIQNGDFENAQINSPFVSSNPADIPGWIHSGTVGDGLLWAIGYSDSGGSVTVAGHGNQFVTLGGGFHVAGSASWTTNTISGLIPGDTYTLSFDIANEGGDVGGPQSMTVFGSSGSNIFDPVLYTAPANSLDYWRIWLPESENFVAGATTASFTFSVSDQAEDMGLDFVQVIPTAVPEPPSLAVLGAGLAGLRVLRGRRRVL
jgi:hypothetical protein